MQRRHICIVLSLLILSSNYTAAIAPPYVTDEQLAASPIIVVAQWDKASIEQHDRYIAWNAVDRIEAHTMLNVLRVIKGPITPGIRPLMMTSGIAWRDDGKWIESGTSTQMLGDVQDITLPCLWFLTNGTSWDSADRTKYLAIDNYRKIQLLVLEKYFAALDSFFPTRNVPPLLAPDQPEVALRVLRYISGGIWPWPYGPGPDELRYENLSERGKLLKVEADRVWQFIGSTTASPRPYALAVYADLTGKKCIPRMRTLLDDKDPTVRAVAAGILIRYQDTESLDGIRQAMQGVQPGWLACKLIDALSSWGGNRVVPALMSFLENDDPGSPAIEARQALHKITGHWFLFNVAASMKAWQETQKTWNPLKRKQILQQLASGCEHPLVAEVVGSPRYVAPKVGDDGKPHLSESLVQVDGSHPPDRDVLATIRIHNVTTQPIAITTQPSDTSVSCPSMGAGAHLELADKPPAAQVYAIIEPGSTLDYQARFCEPFLLAEPATRKMQVSYRTLAKTAGAATWIGTMDVQFGRNWHEERQVKHVEETWPSGNLKVTGTTVNGFRFGEWHFFNEQGDRIRIEIYGTGRGQAECNPKHPDNKGAGKRLRPQKAPGN